MIARQSLMQRTLQFLLLYGALMFSTITAASSDVLESLIKSEKTLTDYSFYVIQGGSAFNVVGGMANPTGEMITPNHLFRIASVTKTFTAATVLRLIEENALQLTDTIDSLISDEFKALLESDSYPIDTITVKHLLSHTAGLFDHAQSQAFLDALLASPTQNKDMAFHINGLINWGEPIAKPDERFFYSDTGYILLGHIIERITQKPLPQAVREYLNFHQNKIYQVVWERDDSVTPPEGLRVHQSFHNIDTYSWDPSMDLYGGGGLLASPRGMAKFFQRLFAGNVFSKPATLEQMLSPLGLPADSPYRLGVFERDYDGLTVYEHSGFWGTQVMVAPKYNVVIAGAVTKQEDYKALVNVMRQYLNAVSQ